MFQKLATLGGEVKQNAEAEAQNEVESESEIRELRSKEGRRGRNAITSDEWVLFRLGDLGASTAAAVNLSKRAHEELRRARTRTNYASSPEAKGRQPDREQHVEEEAGEEMDEVQRNSGARNCELPERMHDQALSGKKRNFGGKAKISIAAERIVNGQVSHTGNTSKELEPRRGPKRF